MTFALTTIKDLLKSNFIYKRIFNSRIEKRQITEIENWKLKGAPLPPPHEYKQQVIIGYSNQFHLKTLVETGTFMGFMIDVMRYRFSKIFSIELDQKLYENATVRFASAKHIEILQGDSSAVLGTLLKRINEPSLFWLDGHYSEGITAKGELNTPIIGELKHILTDTVKDHVVLIDDARCFNGKDDYPTIEYLEKYVEELRPDLFFNVENDIIRIHK